MYAGSRYAKNCNPDEFMKPNGYTTSSILINSIIDSEGLDSFDILRIDTNLDGLSAYNYETLFLQHLNCANSTAWYNKHNNDGISFGSYQFYNQMKSKYGYEFPCQIPQIKEKSRQTRYEKNSGKFNSDEMIEKSQYTKLEKNNGKYRSDKEIEKQKQTNLEKRGVKCSLQCPIVQEKSRQTRYEKNNGKYRSDEDIEKHIKTRIKKNDGNFWSDYQLEKSRQTRYEKNDGKFWSEEDLEKARQTKKEKYGDEKYNNRKKQKQTLIQKYGVDHTSKIPFLSIIETKKTYAKNILSRVYPEFKKLF